MAATSQSREDHPSFRREFATLLAQQRANLIRGLSSAETQLVEIRAAKGNESTDDEHDPEGPTLAVEWSRVEGLRASAQEELQQVEDAVSRLEARTFGVCTACALNIPIERLRVRPSTPHCVACANTPPRR
ncbi:TraR/DksA family transcriptional regulator (plasmid) [Coraliomargarita sp. W4R53]